MSNKARSLILKVLISLLLLQYFFLQSWQSMRAVKQWAVQWESFTALKAAPLTVVITLLWHVVKAVLGRALMQQSKKSDKKGKEDLTVVAEVGEGWRKLTWVITCASSTMQIPKLLNELEHLLTGVLGSRWPANPETHRSQQESVIT